MREVIRHSDMPRLMARPKVSLGDRLREELNMPLEEVTVKRVWRGYRPRFTRRDLLTFWGPLAVVCVLAVIVAYWSDIRDTTVDTAAEMRSAVVDHPEFAVRRVEITGRRETPRQFVLDTLNLDGKTETVSSLDFDVAAARERLIGSPWVEDASVALDPTGTLRLRLEERDPAAIWRVGGKYWLIDAEGQPISTTEGPGTHLDLPYLIGNGANEAIDEARALLLSVPSRVANEVVALVRRGGRRWDVVSKHGYIVKLPQEDALDTLRHYGEGNYGERLKSLAVIALDLRLSDEPPVLQLEPGANELRLEALAALRTFDP